MAFGFFTTEELPTTTFKGMSSKQERRVATCRTCQQFKNCHSPQLSAIGLGEKKILVITGEVTRVEDNSNNEEHSANYSFLRKHLKKVTSN